MSNDKQHVGRRTFIKTVAVGAMTMSAATALGAAANEKLKLGIIGCGGRGNFIGDLFLNNSNTEIVAVHDYFQDKVDGATKRLQLKNPRIYIGLNGYKDLLASDVDAVAITSPAYFHPQQVKDALEAGKHVYLAKPIAVDVPGCDTVVTSAAKHPNLTMWVDFQTRQHPYYIEAVKRLHSGILGDPVFGQAYYHAGRLGVKKGSEPGTPEYRLRNWVFDIALSGDIIVEQNIHMIDVAQWMLQANPIKVTGAGGRRVRTDVGDCWDHFVCTYHYPNDVLIDFSSGQFVHGFSDLCTRLHCSKASIDTHYGGEVVIKGKSEHYSPGATGQIYKSGAVNNIKLFTKSIIEGKPINNAQESANSTRACILGRTAAYKGGEVTWDEMMIANQKLDANLNLS